MTARLSDRIMWRLTLVAVSLLLNDSRLSHAQPPAIEANELASELDIDPLASDLDTERKQARLLIKLRESQQDHAKRQIANTQEIFETLSRLTKMGKVDRLELLRAQATFEKAKQRRDEASIALESAMLKLLTIEKEIKRRASSAKRQNGKRENAKQGRTTTGSEPLKSVGLTKPDLTDCQMHAVGIYRAARDQESDEVFVQVQPTDGCSVIVLSSYNEVMWRISLAKDANVKLVILAGYYRQEASIAGGAEIPVLNLSYFTDGGPSRGPWAYAYSWPTSEGRKLARMLHDVTGLTASTFQGMQSARTIRIDGQRGKLTNRQAKEPVPGLLTDADLAAEPIEFPDGDAGNAKRREQAAAGGTADELISAIASLQIAVRKAEAELAATNEPIKRLDEKIQEAATAASTQDDSEVQDDGSDQLRELVRQQFELRQQQQAKRVALAGKKLQLVEARRVMREKDSQRIIDRRVRELLKKQ